MAMGNILWWVIDVENTEADPHVEATLLYGNLQMKQQDVRKILSVKNDVEFCCRDKKETKKTKLVECIPSTLSFHG